MLALTQGLDDEDEGEETEENLIEFLEAGEDSAIAFEPAEEALDLVSPGV